MGCSHNSNNQPEVKDIMCGIHRAVHVQLLDQEPFEPFRTLDKVDPKTIKPKVMKLNCALKLRTSAYERLLHTSSGDNGGCRS